MLQDPITGRRAWHGDTLDDRSRWYWQIPEDVREALARTIVDRRPIAELRLADTPCGAVAEALRPVLAELEQGRGFVILRGLPTGGCSPEEMSAMYWLVGQMLGRPMEQNVQGTQLYDVKDTGQDVRYGARFSVTNAESSFHTDNSFGEDIVDYVGLLCINSARSGGLSQVVSGFAVHKRLLAEHRALMAVLYQPFQVDRRGGLRPGDAPTIPFPVFASTEGELLVRYLRYWIEVGHEKAGQPLTPQQVAALDTLDRVAALGELRAEFSLEPGDMVFINNRWILHNRTAFEDHDEPERRRHLVRLWLRAR